MEISSKLEFSSDVMEFIKLTIPESKRIFHLFGPPGSGKTTFAIKMAIDTSKPCYFAITSHHKAFYHRLKQICLDAPNLSQMGLSHIYVVPLEDFQGIKKMLKNLLLTGENGSFIVIDNLTDYVRGITYKEEVRNLLREILVDCFLLCEEKNFRVIIINGVSAKSCPAKDIIDSFCETTFEFKKKFHESSLCFGDFSFPLLFSDKGVENFEIIFSD